MKAQLFTLVLLVVSLALVLTWVAAQEPAPVDANRWIFASSNQVKAGELGLACTCAARSTACNVELAGQIGQPAVAVDVQGSHAYMGVGPQSTANLALVGQLGGPILDVAVQSSPSAGAEQRYAYVGIGPRLVILDVSDASNPIVVGQTATLSGVVYKVQVAEPYAYVLNAEGGLHIIDVSNPAAPVEVGFAPGVAEQFYVANGYAYLGWGEYTGSWWTWRGYLRVVDVSNPSVPWEVAVYRPRGAVRGIHVSGGYAYVTTQNYHHSGLTILDVCNPASPKEVSGYFTSSSCIEGGVYVAGHYAYVANVDGLWVLDVSDPASPRRVASASVPASKVYVAGCYAYVTCGGTAVHLVDVSDPAAPHAEGVYISPQPVADLYAAGHYLYVAAGDAGLRVVDASDPAAPQEAGAFGTPGHASHIHVAGRYAYLAAEDRLWVADVSDPAVPRWVGAASVPADDVYVAGHYAYTISRNAGLRVLDISDPAAPQEIGALDVPGQASDIYVVGKYAYVAEEPDWDQDCECSVGGGLRVIDVSDPAAPVKVGAYTGYGCSRVYVAGGHAYVGTDYSGLLVLDVSDPAAPVAVGVYDMRDYVGGVYVAGNYAYVAWWQYGTFGRHGGLRVVDISDPTTPREVGTHTSPWPLVGIHVTGHYAYLAAENGGIRLLDVSDPATPVEVTAYDTPGYASEVHVSGRYAYVADQSGGLLILALEPVPTSASILTSGGSLTSSFDQTSYTFAAGTFTDAVTITHTPRYPGHGPSTGSLTGIGHFFEVSAVHSNSRQPAQPTQPYTVTVGYTDAEKGVAIESTLALYYWDETQWVREPTSTVDTVNHTVAATPDHFSLWAVLGDTRRIFLPTILRRGAGRNAD